jgi:AAA domain
MMIVTLASLVAEPVWVAWKHETRNGKATKVPYSPVTGQRAESNNPATWATRDTSDAWAAAHQAAGVGLMFAQVGDDFTGGVDLDCCRDRNTGEISDWAQAVIDRFGTYAEVSPSETGVKLFLIARRADMSAIEAAFGGASNFGRKFERRNGTAHAPAIEIYRGRRFFTVTGKAVGPIAELRALDPADLDWLLQDYGPKFAGKAKAADDGEDDDDASDISGFDWPTDVRDHDELVSLAMRFVLGGMNPGMVSNYLRACVAAADFEGNEERRERRLDDISRAVSSAEEKIKANNRQKANKAPATPESFDAGDEDDEDDAALPLREWLLGTSFCRGYLSGLISAGGSGKTTVRIAQLLSAASYRNLTGEHVFVRCRVLVVCLEDDLKELRRRVKAARIHHGVTAAEVKAFFHLWTPRNMKIAELDAKGRVVEGKLLDALRQEIDERQLDLICIDPVVKAHAVNENDNAQIDAFATMLANLAAEKDIAIDLLAHERKGGVNGTFAGDANRSRGASSLKDAQRLAKTLTNMSAEEAKAFGVPEEERGSYVRMDNAKVNIAPASRKATWFKLIGVPIGRPSKIYPNGDNVQTVEVWTPPEMFADTDIEGLNAVLKRLDDGMENGQRYAVSPDAKGRAAWIVMQEQFPPFDPK